MNIFRKMETFFEQNIEGFFNKKFSGGLQPVEIAREMARQMEDARSVSVSCIYVPNHYTVFLSDADYGKLGAYGQVISEELGGYLLKEAQRRGYTMAGRPIVDIRLAEKPFKGAFLVTNEFSEPLPADGEEAVDSSGDAGDLSDTQVFQRTTLVRAGRQINISAMLTVIDGLDTGTRVDMGYGRVNLGRREGNELPLADMNTSRLHAFITFEGGKHIIHDAKSLNGTYVNGHRVTRKELEDGDRIKVGSTVILYEVK